MDKRNAISRAYYAAYHRAMRAYPFRPGLNQTSHKSYFEYLMKSELRPPARLIGSKLKAMHSHRITADYKINVKLFRSILDIQLASAQEILNLIDSYEMCGALPEKKEG